MLNAIEYVTEVHIYVGRKLSNEKCICRMIGFALKCFVCDSSANPKCRDLSDHALQPQECIAENFLSQGAGLFSQLGFGGSSNSASKSEDLSPICLKVVTHNSKSI